MSLGISCKKIIKVHPYFLEVGVDYMKSWSLGGGKECPSSIVHAFDHDTLPTTITIRESFQQGNCLVCGFTLDLFWCRSLNLYSSSAITGIKDATTEVKFSPSVSIYCCTTMRTNLSRTSTARHRTLETRCNLGESVCVRDHWEMAVFTVAIISTRNKKEKV